MSNMHEGLGCKENKIIDYDYCNKWMEGKYNKLLEENTNLKKQLADLKDITHDKILDALQSVELQAGEDSNDFYIPDDKYDMVIDKIIGGE